MESISSPSQVRGSTHGGGSYNAAFSGLLPTQQEDANQAQLGSLLDDRANINGPQSPQPNQPEEANKGAHIREEDSKLGGNDKQKTDGSAKQNKVTASIEQLVALLVQILEKLGEGKEEDPDKVNERQDKQLKALANENNQLKQQVAALAAKEDD